MAKTKAYGLSHEKADTIVYITSDYNKFFLIRGNRMINHENVLRIRRSMDKHNLFNHYPMLVTPVKIGRSIQLAIVDGQHRLEAAKRKKEPVYYTIGEDLTTKDIELVNTNSLKWTGMQYLNLYTEADDVPDEVKLEYKKVKEYMDRHNFTLENAVAALSLKPLETDGIPTPGNWYFHAPLDKFRAGAFKVVDMDTSEDFAEVLKKFVPLIEDDRMLRQRPFLGAIWRLYVSEKVDIDDFIEKIKRLGMKISMQHDLRSYRLEFIDILNRNKHSMVTF